MFGRVLVGVCWGCGRGLVWEWWRFGRVWDEKSHILSSLNNTSFNFGSVKGLCSNSNKCLEAV